MKESLTQKFVRQIEQKLFCRQLKKGDRLPSLRQLAAEYAMSRSVINAGIVELENKGYLKIVPTKWIEVTDWETEGSLAILTSMAEAGALTDKVLESLLESRKFISLECVRLACENATQEQVVALDKLVRCESNKNNALEKAAADRKFHHLISIMSGNFIYPLIMKSFEKVSYHLVRDFYEKEGVFAFVHYCHNVIKDAIAKKDAPLATATMLQLLEHGENSIKGKT